MKNILRNCTLCPRNCHVDRYVSNGFCNAGSKIKIARAALHYWEEPCISGKNGSGAIFFTFCNLKCVFCQNYDISTNNIGRVVTIKKFGEICLDLQQKGAQNINLVTPTHYVPLIIKGLKIAKKNGLCIPIIYNTSSYENISTIRMLDGNIDVYLPDFKYWDNDIAIKYSNASNYRQIAIDSINEMYKQVGKVIIKNRVIQKGLIVRILVLPNRGEDCKKIIAYLYNKYKSNIYISIMNQFTPVIKTKYEELNHKLDTMEYDNVVNYAYDIGVRNAFIQVGETQDESFIPDFKNQKF